MEVNKRFHERQATHLPVVDNGNFIGCISLEDSYSLEADKTLADYRYILNRMFISEKANWMDILQEYGRYNANLLPVIDVDGKHIGDLEMEDFIHSLTKVTFLNEPGTILVIKAATQHYSASQVSQIVESNNAKITGMFITSFDDNSIECNIKINTNNINEIVQTFRRYGYEIISEHVEDTYLEGLKERSKYLQKYLDI